MSYKVVYCYLHSINVIVKFKYAVAMKIHSGNLGLKVQNSD